MHLCCSKRHYHVSFVIMIQCYEHTAGPAICFAFNRTVLFKCSNLILVNDEVPSSYHFSQLPQIWLIHLTFHQALIFKQLPP